MKWKNCSSCKESFPLTSNYFHRDRSQSSGLRGSCKMCATERVRKAYTPKVRILPLGFKPLPYSNKYYISNNGKVWSYKLNRLMKPYKHSDGYLQLNIDGHCKKVHQLVLESFAGISIKGMVACHNDGNTENNNLLNLRWATRSSNAIDSVRHKTHYIAKLTESKVRNIKKMLRSHIPHKVMANMYNVHQSTISYINTGRIWNYVQMDE